MPHKSINSRPRFSGIIPPLVTPLTETGDLDTPGLERLLEHVIAGGVTGVFLLGTNGEGPSIGPTISRKLVEHACGVIAGRVSVLVGVTDTAAERSIGLARLAADHGADAVVLAPPFYLPMTQGELIGYVRRITPQFPLPVMLYNIPQFTKTTFEPGTLRELADIPRVFGVKDSSGDLGFFKRLLPLCDIRPDWSLMIGPEHLMPDAVKLGAHGGVNGGANIFPQLFTQCYNAAMGGDEPQLTVLKQRIDELQALYTLAPQGVDFIRATKAALGALGLCQRHMAEPFVSPIGDEFNRIDRFIKPFSQQLFQGVTHE